jgi:hypothetical protein
LRSNILFCFSTLTFASLIRSTPSSFFLLRINEGFAVFYFLISKLFPDNIIIIIIIIKVALFPEL